MASRRNAIKKIRADEKKRVLNRARSAELSTLLRNFENLIGAKKIDQAQTLSRTLFSRLDRAVKRGSVKENTASRKKSRISRRLTLAQAK